MQRDHDKLNPGHAHVRQVLRLAGPLLVCAGLVFMAIAMASFFSAFGTFEPPRYFWCFFVGIPLLGAGLALTKFGFLGAITRYYTGEVAPVGKDAFNYLAEGTKPGVRTAAAALAEGLAAGSRAAQEPGAPCPQCHHRNSEAARFCSQCGTPLSASKACPSCRERNNHDARFCDNCGQPFEAEV